MKEIVPRLLMFSFARRQMRTLHPQRLKKGRHNMPGQKWLIHFAHENSFLSWSRNAVISMAAAGSCLVAKEYLPMTKKAGEAFTDVGLIFMTVGTAEYIYHTWKLRTRLLTPPTRLWWVTGYSLAILAAWAYGASHLQRQDGLWSHITQFKIRFATYLGFSSRVYRTPNRGTESTEDATGGRGGSS